MRKIFLLATALTALSAPAFAADMAVKAPKANVLVFPYTGSGMYWGVGIKAAVAQTSTSGTPLFANSLLTGNLAADGGGVGGQMGYMYGMGSTWVAWEVTADWQNITASQNVVATPATTAILGNAGIASRWTVDEVVKVGGWNPFAIIGSLGFNFPTLPAPPTISGINILPTGHPYIMAGVQEFGIEGSFFTAGGTSWGVAPLVGAGILNQITDTSGKLTGAVLDTGAQVVFANKGVTVNGLFATPNGMAAFGPALNMGTKYEAYAKIDF